MLFPATLAPARRRRAERRAMVAQRPLGQRSGQYPRQPLAAPAPAPALQLRPVWGKAQALISELRHRGCVSSGRQLALHSLELDCAMQPLGPRSCCRLLLQLQEAEIGLLAYNPAPV